jgi:methionyl aminopeptidase
MDEETFEKYRQAGKIAATVRTNGSQLLKPGASLFEIAETIEQDIMKRGAKVAFPVNISINEIAAHYSPWHNDKKVIKKGDVVKLDVGAHIDGFIADTAVTIEVGTHAYSDMITASKKALETAIDMITANIDLSSVGTAIEKVITSYGYHSIDNLTGHSLEPYSLHSGISVPNVADWYPHHKPKAGTVIAIEPFATNGAGHVLSGAGSNIYHATKSIGSRLLREQQARVLLHKINTQFGTLPFAERWCHQVMPGCTRLLHRLSLSKAIKQYPQLIDAKKGIVTQCEHTVIVLEDGCEVIT